MDLWAPAMKQGVVDRHTHRFTTCYEQAHHHLGEDR
jgi:hypothetical protein